MERRVRWHVENPTAVETVPDELEVWLNGEPLLDGTTIYMAARGETGYIGLDFAFHNRAERNVRTLNFRVGFSTSLFLDHATDRHTQVFESVSLKERRLFKFPYQLTLLPQEWSPMDMRFSKRHGNVVAGETHNVTVHAYFDSGVVSRAFQVAINGPASQIPADA